MVMLVSDVTRFIGVGEYEIGSEQVQPDQVATSDLLWIPDRQLLLKKIAKAGLLRVWILSIVTLRFGRRNGATEPAPALSIDLLIREAAPVCSCHRVRLVQVQRLNPCLEQVEGGRSDIEALVSGLVSNGDALSGLVIGTAYSPQHRGGPNAFDRSPHAIPFSPRPETVIENNVEAQ